MSDALWERARGSLAGGVSSPVRAFRAVGGSPRFLVRGSGAHVEDSEGRQYIDLNMAWGPLLLGHAHPEVVEAVVTAAKDGLHFGACHPLEAEVAERVVAAHPSAERVRFVSSGTEAVMSAVRLARHATGRDKIVAFQGCYHGHADLLLAAGGSGLATFGISGAPGVPDHALQDTAFLPLGDVETLRSFFEKHGDEVACVVLEGVPANNGLLPQTPAFMHEVARLCRAHGALFLLDEVITGFRLGMDGAAGRYGVRPDLVTFGKVLGGGAPIAAYAGSAELMDLVAPEGPVYQAGTLSGSPVALAAANATLDILARERPWTRLEGQTGDLMKRLHEAAEVAGVPMAGTSVASILWPVLQDGETPARPEEIRAEAVELFRRLHAAALDAGVYLPPSAYEVWFLSTAHDDKVVDELVARLTRAVAAVEVTA